MVKEGIADKEHFAKVISGIDFTKNSSIDGLSELEEKIIKHSPLPINYDLNRPQNGFFDEFTYTELMNDYIIVSPMSIEAQARLVKKASMSVNTDKVNLSLQDKYQELKPIEAEYKKVVFLPGSNLLWRVVSKEALYRVMHENQDAVIKMHPLTSPEDAKKLKVAFGKTRLVCPKVSGIGLLKSAEKVYTTAHSELGVIASLMGKQVEVVSNFFKEHEGTYYCLYQYRNNILALNSIFHNPVLSGIFHKNTRQSVIREYFDNAMEMREFMRPVSSIVYAGEA